MLTDLLGSLLILLLLSEGCGDGLRVLSSSSSSSSEEDDPCSSIGGGMGSLLTWKKGDPLGGVSPLASDRADLMVSNMKYILNIGSSKYRRDGRGQKILRVEHFFTWR